MKYEYKPRGVCSKKFIIEVNDNSDVVEHITIVGGCNGNTQGVSRLCEGMKREDVISKIEGIKCGIRPTSCPDQLAKALKEMVK